jgi:hypothetical protein
MSTSAHKSPLAEDRTIGLAENWKGVVEAAIGFLTLIAFVLFMVGTSCSFVLGAFYLKSLVTDLPLLSQFFGP